MSFDRQSLSWCEDIVSSCKPCPFCGERLVVHNDRHGAWIGHKNELSQCFDAGSLIMDSDDVSLWNMRSGT